MVRALTSFPHAMSNDVAGLTAPGSLNRLKSNPQIDAIEQRTGDSLGVATDRCSWASALTAQPWRCVSVAARARVGCQEQLKISGHLTGPTRSMQAHHTAFQRLTQGLE